MTTENLQSILQRIRSTSLAVVGDVCLDTYLFLSDESEISLETGLATQVVHTARAYLGGAGNVAANCAALGAGNVALYGVIGDDMYGREVRHLCAQQGIELGGLVTQTESWHTNVYTKLYRHGCEEPRIDIGTLNQLHPSTADAVLAKLRNELQRYDAVIVNQQIENGLHSPAFRAELAQLLGRLEGIPVFLDSRQYSDEYPGSIRKLNTQEARRLLETEHSDTAAENEPADLALRLAHRWATPVYLTRGDAGCIVADGDSTMSLPALLITGATDSVGAGDSMLAGIAAGQAAGASYVDAAALGGLAAGVTVRKRFCTGVASPEEVLRVGSDPDYLYNPDIASAPWSAEYFEDSNVEVIGPRPHPARHRFRYAIFDHDGTISTIREGWEQIMEPVMCAAILGKPLAAASAREIEPVRSAVREFIDRTTGYQTIYQMQELATMVRDFGHVPESEIKSAEEYKALYNAELMNSVTHRLVRFRRGELSIDDVTIKNSLHLLKHLQKHGVVLYLASGTDHNDVLNEAEVLGYAHLFDGGIVGSVGDIDRDPKRMVLRKILSEIGTENAAAVLTFGDGPVEIRETKKLGGYAVGVASDEVRRYGLNLNKRERLVRAGAEAIVPDYSQLRHLLEFLAIVEPGAERL